MSTAAALQRTALVTGANRGIGLEIARQLIAKGWKVLVAARQLESAQAAAQELGENALPLCLDVANDQSVHAAAATAASLVDHLDALINNAAVALDDAGPDASQMEIETLLATLQTNTLGPLRVIQAFLTLLEHGEQRRIVNVSSGAGQLSDPMGGWAPAYCVSKTALNGLTVQLDSVLQPRGFAINAVSPGWVRTDMGGSNAPLSVEEGADSIVWLATEAPQGLSGKFIRERQVIPW